MVHMFTCWQVIQALIFIELLYFKIKHWLNV